MDDQHTPGAPASPFPVSGVFTDERAVGLTVIAAFVALALLRRVFRGAVI
jgi:hypothetical protein